MEKNISFYFPRSCTMSDTLNRWGLSIWLQLQTNKMMKKSYYQISWTMWLGQAALVRCHLYSQSAKKKWSSSLIESTIPRDWITAKIQLSMQSELREMQLKTNYLGRTVFHWTIGIALYNIFNWEQAHWLIYH